MDGTYDYIMMGGPDKSFFLLCVCRMHDCRGCGNGYEKTHHTQSYCTKPCAKRHKVIRRKHARAQRRLQAQAQPQAGAQQHAEPREGHAGVEQQAEHQAQPQAEQQAQLEAPAQEQVYAIQQGEFGNEFIVMKIGRSVNPARRAQQLQTGNSQGWKHLYL